MAAFNNGFPATYQQMYYPQPAQYQPAQMYQPMQQQAPQAQQQQPASRLIEVFPADSEADAEKFPVNAGGTAVLFARNDSFIAVKSVGVNGQTAFDIYDKRPPAPPAPVFNPGEYVRKDEIENLVSAVLAAQTATKHAAKKEGE